MRDVFLDRDGVLNVERADYVKSPAELVLLPRAAAAVALLAERGARIFVVTNQAGVNRGRLNRRDVDAVNDRLRHLLELAGGRVDAFFVCPHRPDEGCDCRKPRPGMLLEARDTYDVDLARAVLIGDNLTDVDAARAVGCEAILVKSGRRPVDEATADLAAYPGLTIVDDVFTAALIVAARQPAAAPVVTAGA